jgi:putative intracellular protease/amidase
MVIARRIFHMRLSIVLFDGFTALDVVGGYEVLARLPGMETDFVAATPGTIAADTRRLGMIAVRALADAPAPDILYVPGGPGALRREHDAAFLDQLRRLDATSTWTVGICNGVGLLGAAGLLRGKTATTNFFYRDRLAGHGATVVPARYHRDGKYITGAGVSASIDTALFLTQLMLGDAVAKTLQLGIEYYPAPPFPERTPEEAPRQAQDLIRGYEQTAGTASLAALPPFPSVDR